VFSSLFVTDNTEKYAYTSPSQGIESGNRRSGNRRSSLITKGKTNNREITLLSFISAGLLAGCAGTHYTPAPYETGDVDTSAYVVSDFWMIYKEEGKAALQCPGRNHQGTGCKSRGY